eukprot:g2137.t1
MVKQAVVLEVEEDENVEKIEPSDETMWHLLLVDPNSGDERKIVLDPTNEEEIDGSRGSANFIMTWKGSKRQCSISIITTAAHNIDSTDDEQPLVVFECRNAEIKACSLSDDSFLVTSTGGYTFSDVDLSDDWADFDEENDESVSLMGISTKVIKMKESGKGKGRRRKK